MVPHGTMWYHIVPYGIIWYHMVPYGTIWYHRVPYGTVAGVKAGVGWLMQAFCGESFGDMCFSVVCAAFLLFACLLLL